MVPPEVFPLAMEQSPFPCEIVNHEGTVLYANAAHLRVLGPASALPAVLSSGRNRSEALAAARRDGLWRADEALETLDAGTIVFRLTAYPLSTPEGGHIGVAVICEDLSAEREADNAREQERNLAAIRARQSQMGELLSMIAHQWRQPLTVISSLIGNVQLKAQIGGVDPAYLLAKLERMGQTVQYLSETIDAFRHFYAPSPFKTDEDLAFLARRAVELLTPGLHKLGAQIEFLPPEGPVSVKVFAGEVLQVVLELVTNARDALAAAKVAQPQVRVTVGTEGSVAFLAVENNSGEISEAVLPHLYEPYFGTRVGSGGPGLGLYMAKLIIESQHGGTLTASSRNGWVTFRFVLPVEVNA